MFHSFKEFHRLVTAACCLFLAGKVEETPKKCKDIIKTFRSMLTDAQFAHFGDDPKEEVMTLERILLQTIKFDLMVEHPYAYLLKFAKLIKGDKSKVQKMVQMAWTFINDSLCTTLCLQWEPEIIAVAVMYLTSRLTKFDITDWQGKPSGYRGKWYEFIVEDVTLELLEDICHQVLDLYSKTPHPQKDVEPILSSRAHAAVASSDDSQSRLTPRTPQTPKSPSSVKKNATGSTGSLQPMETDTSASLSSRGAVSHSSDRSSGSQAASGHHSANSGSSSYSAGNPYMSKHMYSSSFMSTEGSQSIQSLIGVQTREELGRSSSSSHAYLQTQTGSSSQYSLTPTFQSLPQASAGHSTQHGQAPSASAAASGYRSSSSHHAAVGHSQTQQSYQHSSSSSAGQTYQPASGNQPSRQSYQSSSGSYPSSPVSTVYQGYSGRTTGSDYSSGVVHPGSQHSYEQQYASTSYPSSASYQPPQQMSSSQYVTSQSAYHAGHYHGQPVSYQTSQYSQHQNSQSSGRSNSRSQNWR